jgi:iron complex outermembrane receptor protein
MNCRNLLCKIILPTFLLLFSSVAFAQSKTVTGRVTDAAGTGAASVTLSAKGQNIANGEQLNCSKLQLMIIKHWSQQT